MPHSLRSALTPDENAEGTVERSPVDARDLECASVEPDSTDLIVWNKEGQPTRVVAGDQDALVALMLRGKLKLDHFLAIIDAMEQNIEHFGPLLELFRAMVGYLPPEEFGRARERLMMLWQTETRDVVKTVRVVGRAARRGARSAVLLLAAGLIVSSSGDPDDSAGAGAANIAMVA